MKEATGQYVLVRAITQEEAISLAEELFRAEGAKLWAEGDKLWAEGAKLWAELARRFYTLEEAAVELRRCRKTIWRWTVEGKIAFHQPKPNCKILIPLEEIIRIKNADWDIL